MGSCKPTRAENIAMILDVLTAANIPTKYDDGPGWARRVYGGHAARVAGAHFESCAGWHGGCVSPPESFGPVAEGVVRSLNWMAGVGLVAPKAVPTRE